MTTTLDDLIARLSAATGASKELDWAIAEYLGEIPEHSIREVGFDYDWYRSPGEFTLWKALDSEGRSMAHWSPAPRTGSLDAAMTLCSYGMHSIEFHLEPGGWVVSIDGFTATAATRELAFSAAALKARKARP